MPTLTDPVAIAIGPLEVRWYAIFIMSGIAAAIGLSYWLAARRGLDPDFLLDIAPWVVFIAIAGARLYYVILEWERFRDDFGDAINIRTGGLAIHGALAAGVVTIIVLCRTRGQPTLTWLDIIAAGAGLGQAIGRWGNWANQEAFGKPTDLPWAVTIAPARRPDEYAQDATFHPTFLYESLFNLANAVFLSWLVLRGPRLGWLRPGDVLATYMVTYGVARFVIERMRTDSLYIGPLPAALWLSMAMVAGGGILFILNRTVFDEGATVPETV